MYLTYEEYQAMGGTLEQTAFKDLEYEARTYIDWVTFNRLHAPKTVITEPVKECVYHIIKLVQLKMDALGVSGVGGGSSSTGGVIASQSNDGVSVSYNIASAKDIIDSSDKEMSGLVTRYLQGLRNSLGHRLTYRGIYPDEVIY